jgi:hypothetical protein
LTREEAFAWTQERGLVAVAEAEFGDLIEDA